MPQISSCLSLPRLQDSVEKDNLCSQGCSAPRPPPPQAFTHSWHFPLLKHRHSLTHLLIIFIVIYVFADCQLSFICWYLIHLLHICYIYIHSYGTILCCYLVLYMYSPVHIFPFSVFTLTVHHFYLCNYLLYIYSCTTTFSHLLLPGPVHIVSLLLIT